MKINNLFRC